MASPNIVFYFDCASSFSYIGFEFMEKYQQLWDIPVDYRPFILSDVMANARNTFSPYKLPFLFADLKRTSSITKIPFRGTPAKYPYDPQVALRTLQYLKTHQPHKMAPAMRSLWNMEYVQLKAPESVDDVKYALKDVVEPEVVDFAMGADETLEVVRQNTEQVKKMKGFGAPTILVSKGDGSKSEMFFGSDRFEHIAIFLDKEPLTMKQLFAGSKL
ncbi:hypothetical protein GGH19_003361 [Coemansia sp. RSA 1807]|nr:hypothetical protein LPJ58_005548 [Coemansia sp. RSA 1591]KAJ1754080.1 hypothetical protein LPJ69_005552 [Coemansia sp. RSA 1752]KAJ1781509.1 hypothetical protein LPJ67_005458 [Coemansia sp. RSA 1938]KAJ2139780.1 hypothetical protein GGH17_000262 [Coemansia sp. RSA 788]KAJ2141774.1 hypothetical protein IW142_004674 [Coemansia sp. RSA 564]KAJ2168413.1 hypothetical protein GGH15_001425 [Coemansia sp. RSA 562]KAJ2185635.1 hypothetical protein EV181_003760 [Coemansia sp. RSA 532]KAJ2196611.1 